MICFQSGQIAVNDVLVAINGAAVDQMNLDDAKALTIGNEGQFCGRGSLANSVPRAQSCFVLYKLVIFLFLGRTFESEYCGAKRNRFHM